MNASLKNMTVFYLAPGSWHDTQRYANDRSWLQAVGARLVDRVSDAAMVIFRPYAEDGAIEIYVAKEIQAAYDAELPVFEMIGNMCSGLFLQPTPCVEPADVLPTDESVARNVEGRL